MVALIRVWTLVSPSGVSYPIVHLLTLPYRQGGSDSRCVLESQLQGIWCCVWIYASENHHLQLPGCGQA
jgi:hypothetical protein